MNKRIFTLFFALMASVTGVWADVQINETNFPDDEFRYWVKKNCQSDNNNVLTDAEIAKVTEMDVHGKMIEKLKGIEYFTKLQKLDCHNNWLQELDLSKNVNLQELDCSECYITSLKVSPGALNLRTIKCYQNRLSQQAVSDFFSSLPLLVMYGMFGNVFLIDSDADDEGNEMVDSSWYSSFLGIGWFLWGKVLENWYDYASYCAYMAPQVPIDASKFPDANFRQLVKDKYDKNGDNGLGIAEMQKVYSIWAEHKQIESLKGIEYFTELTWLYCTDNNLTSLDVSKNTKLKWIECGYNKLTSLDVSKNTALVHLNCDNNQLTSLNVKNNKELNVLWCHENNINMTEMGKLVESLPTVPGDVRGLFIPYSVGSDDDKNVITTTQVAQAKKKNWRVACYDFSIMDYDDYWGVDLSGIADNNREPITNNRYYNLNGHRIDSKPAQKGVYIHGGKKVVVK